MTTYIDLVPQVQADDLRTMEGPVGLYSFMSDLWAGIEATANDVGYDVFKTTGKTRLYMAELRHTLTWLAAEADRGNGPVNLANQAAKDVEVLRYKDAQYGGSWKRRGGIGAFMMMCRKWDRIDQQVKTVGHGDIYRALSEDRRDEGILDDINDLRCYLLLIEAEWRCLDNAGQTGD